MMRYEIRSKRNGNIVYASNCYGQALRHLAALRPTFDYVVVDTEIEAKLASGNGIRR